MFRSLLCRSWPEGLGGGSQELTYNIQGAFEVSTHEYVSEFGGQCHIAMYFRCIMALDTAERLDRGSQKVVQRLSRL